MSNSVPGPAGEITKRRPIPGVGSFDDGSSSTATVAEPGLVTPPDPLAPPLPELLFPPEPPPLGREDTRRQRGPGRERTRPETSWRPVAVAVGDVSASRTVPILCPPVNGVNLRRVHIRIRTTLAASSTDYWTFSVAWIDAGGTEALVAEYSTDTLQIVANEHTEVYHDRTGFRLQQNHEAVLKAVPTGSPAALDDLAVYADTYAGV